MKVVVVEQDLVTALGVGVEACWAGLISGKPAFSEVTRFSTKAFAAHIAAFVPGLDEGKSESLVMQMLVPLLTPLAGKLPHGTLVLLATTTGEVDLLQRELLQSQCGAINRMSHDGAPFATDDTEVVPPKPVASDDTEVVPPNLGGSGSVPTSELGVDESRLNVLLARVQVLLGVTEPGRIISAACASSSAAVAHGASLIATGARDSVLVVACDAVTEFIYAGFASLMALDPDGARPFDKARKGLTVGEGAGFVWLMSEARARREARPRHGVVVGWGLSCDANHMTGPSRDGAGLARAITQALNQAGGRPDGVGSLSAHGTGTSYNDSMEMKAFKSVFSDRPLPVYSVKGCMGHTMGLAGLAEMIMALKSMEVQLVPPSSNLHEVDPEAEGWVSAMPHKTTDMNTVLSTNSGFGGVNAALVLSL